MPRETAREKADRLLLEGRVVLTIVDPHTVRARVRGEGHIYKTEYAHGVWSCNCPARSDGCSHLHAVRRVVAVDVDAHQQRPHLRVIERNP
jgi:hypothetical protein